MRTTASVRGMTLIDVVIGSAIMLVIFLGLFGAFQLSIELVYNTKAKSGAVALATERMEYVRSLSYDSVGTEGGIPAGAIPQLEQMSLNGISYIVRTLIQYEDAPEDGLAELDENGITADYKTVKVEVSWLVRGLSRSTFSVTRVAPRGLETITGGGTLRVNVIDSVGAPVSGAVVRVVNPDADPAIDVTTSTNDGGSVVFPGAPSASGYQITVTKDEFSSAQTYDSTLENPNPNPGHVAIVEGTTSTLSFTIDELASLMVRTFEPAGLGAFSDTFLDSSNLSNLSSTETSGGDVILLDNGSGYPATGGATSDAVAPQYLASWDEFSWDASTPAGTGALMHVYYFDGSEFSLISDDDLPGNSIGLSVSPIDLSALSTETHDQLQIEVLLSTTDASTTPAVHSWDVSYIAGPTPLPNVDFDIRGSKTIGTTGGGLPIYKVEESYVTDQYGEQLIDPLEADAYQITLMEPSYDLYERCPFSLSAIPGADAELSLTLTPSTSNSLLANIEGDQGSISGATVSITGP